MTVISNIQTPVPQEHTPLIRNRPTWRQIVRIGKRLVPLALAGWLFPSLTLFYIVWGLIDVLRNSDRSAATLSRYFFGNGVLTWLLSPLNLLLDLLTLPYFNKGVYSLTDLPAAWQDELREVIRLAENGQFLSLIHDHMAGRERVMFFFKWYGIDNTKVDLGSEFHRPFRFVRTIGVSAFNGRQSTSQHFGPLRGTLRALYNVGSPPTGDSFIVVGKHVNHWREHRLFIFDDTLMHQSVNDSETIRYCMFIDILRPTLCPSLLRGILNCIRFISIRWNHVFYKHWHVFR